MTARRRRRQRRTAGARSWPTCSRVDDVALSDVRVDEVDYDLPGDHHRRSLVGQRPRATSERAKRAVPHLREAGPVLGAAPVLPVRACGVPRDGGGRRPVAHRGGGLPLRPRRPAARRLGDAARSGRLGPRRAVRRHLDRGGDRARGAWDLDRYERAAYLLGRLAASRRGGPARGPARHRVDAAAPTSSVAGRSQVVPMLMGDDVWQHPLCAAFDEALRDRLRAAAGRAVDLAAEGDGLPWLLSHGDACPNNLLAGSGRRHRDDRLRLLGRGAGRASTSASCWSATSRSASAARRAWPRSTRRSCRRTSRGCAPRAATSRRRRSAGATRCALLI